MQTFRTLIARISWRRALPVMAVCLLLIAPSLAVAFQLVNQGQAQGVIVCPTATAQPTASATVPATTPTATGSPATTPATTSPLWTSPTPTATPTMTGTQTPTPTAPVLCTPTPCPTATGGTGTPQPTASVSPTTTPSPTPTRQPTVTPTATGTQTPAPTTSPTATPTVGAPCPPATGTPPAKIAWSAFDGGGQRLGANTSETTITTSTVSKLTRLYRATLPDIVDSSPIFAPQVATANGAKDLLFATTTHGSLLAIDVSNDQTRGKIVWHTGIATTGTRITTSSPAIDPNGQFVYSYVDNGMVGTIHRYAIGTGKDMSGGGWPVTVSLIPQTEKASSALNIANGYLYATISAYVGDGGRYIGHAVAINLQTGKMTVFNALCANVHTLLSANACPESGAGIWARGGAVADAPMQGGGTGNVFLTTGNGPYNANVGGFNYGDTIVQLSPDLTKIIDTYTPTDYATLQAGDLDLGSAAPVLLPPQNKQMVLLQFGKDQTVRLINRQNMSGQKGPNHLGGALQSLPLGLVCSVLTQPAVMSSPATGTMIFVATNCGFAAFKVSTTGGKVTLTRAFQTTTRGSSPFIAGGLVFVQSNGALLALDPAKNGQVVWSSTQPGVGGSIGALHWQSPLVVNGRIYVVDNSGHLTVYGLPTP